LYYSLHVFVLLQSHFYFVKYGQGILESRIILEEDLDYLCLRVPQQFFIAAKSKQCPSSNNSVNGNLLRFETNDYLSQTYIN